MINILYGTGSPGVVTVGIYDTLSDPVYDNYYTSPNIDVGIVTATSINVGPISATSFEVSGVTTTFISGITSVGLGTTSNPPYNAQMSFELTSNTNLRIRVRGTDGVLRMANITLS